MIPSISVTKISFVFLLVSPFLASASPIPDPIALPPTLAAQHPPTPVDVVPRQAPSRRMGKRVSLKPKALQKKDYSAFLCPDHSVACPVIPKDQAVTKESIEHLESSLNALTDWFTVGFECVELETELNQCGGCLAMGQGADCSKIPNAKTTGCEASACKVYNCFEGYTVSSDQKSCVKRGAGREQETPAPVAGFKIDQQPFNRRDHSASL